MLQNTYKWKHYMKQIAKALGIAQQEHCKNIMKICKRKEIK
jgi:hypothetical protein